MKLDVLSNTLVLLGIIGIPPCLCMPESHIKNLRHEAMEMFHHGFESYMNFAYPADEIRPLSCIALDRDHEPNNSGMTDVLGNYSLTAIDSLSALGILSVSSPRSYTWFWETVQRVSGTYWGYGFDRDSKVQVFETVIRGVGGLISGHQFAVGMLPIPGKPGYSHKGWKYNDELLHLAHDLATRLLPAFTTDTGLPYPRVNLRYGCVNFRPPPVDTEHGEKPADKCRKDEEEAEKAGFKPLRNERTETCAAGAGSLTLELTTLTRLLQNYKTNFPERVEIFLRTTPHMKHRWDDVEIFERVSQQAFWAVWERRSSLDLVGGGLDAVTGAWEPQSGSLAGIGASTDSFFEYAMKTYILLSSSPTVSDAKNPNPRLPHEYLDVFETSVAAINKYMLVESPAFFYQGVHMATGEPMVQWVDSLSAFWPGLLVLAGDVATAERACLFYTALWQRYQALPERYVPAKQSIQLNWWPGRPEFAESVYHLYRATKDVWYLRVGEMILRDIQRRCWGRCGWGGLEDVKSGKVSDRMESFLLSETVAYLYLLFDEAHPLHKGDIPWVFTTEGHPIVMPKGRTQKQNELLWRKTRSKTDKKPRKNEETCENVKVSHPNVKVGELFSRTASRTDTFHSYNAVGLHLLPDNVPRAPTTLVFLNRENIPEEFGYFNDKDEENPYRYITPYSPTNGSFYPWTLPPQLIEPSSYCAKLPGENKIDLVFSVIPVKIGEIPPPSWIDIKGGVLINSLSGLRIGFSRELVEGRIEYFITKIGDRLIRQDEVVVIEKINIDSLQVDGQARFRTSKDEGYEVIFDFETEQKPPTPTPTPTTAKEGLKDKKVEIKMDGKDLDGDILKRVEEILWDSFKNQIHEKAPAAPRRTLTPKLTSKGKAVIRRHLHAILSSGIGAQEVPPLTLKTHAFLKSMEYTPSPTLPWRSVYVAGLGCDYPLPSIAATYPIILFKRGKCPFSQKMNNLPTSSGIKLAIVVNFDDTVVSHKLYEEVVDLDNGGGVNDWAGLRDDYLIRPLLDKYQVDSRNGQRRKNPIPLVFVGGGEATYAALREARGVGLRERWKVSLDGIVVGNFVPVV
ncbi:alpha mannosidase-like protein [Orbilia oligospora]|nr:alpha mannosidase-like protein [Orbilia oligospora]